MVNTSRQSPFTPPRDDKEPAPVSIAYPKDYRVEDVPLVDGELLIRHRGPWSGAQLVLDGKILEPKWGKYQLPLNNGTTVTARLGGFDIAGLVPALTIGKTVYRVGPRIPMLLAIYGVLPFGLIFVGGALGGFLGALGWSANRAISMKTWAMPVRLGVITLVNVGSLALFALAAMIFSKWRDG